MKNLFFIDKMIAPKIITVLYWIAIAFCLVAGLASLYNGEAWGLAVIFLGPFAARLFAESTIVIFKIYEKISKIADRVE